MNQKTYALLFIILLNQLMSYSLLADMIHDAAMGGRDSFVRSLIEKDTSTLHKKNLNGYTPLRLALQYDQIKVIETILCNYADFIDIKEMNNQRETLIFTAANFSGLTSVQLLINAGADPLITNINKQSVMHATALSIHPEASSIATLFIQKKVPIDTKDIYDMTPLHIASKSGNYDVSNLLLKNKANINAKDISGRTALHIAAENGKKRIVQLLLDHSAPFSEKCLNSGTALHLAIQSNQIETVGVLIQKRTIKELTIKNSDGKTPLRVALELNRHEIINLMIQAGVME